MPEVYADSLYWLDEKKICIRMPVRKTNQRDYKPRYLKRRDAIGPDPCDECIVTACCTRHCEEKNDYLWKEG